MDQSGNDQLKPSCGGPNLGEPENCPSSNQSANDLLPKWSLSAGVVNPKIKKALEEEIARRRNRSRIFPAEIFGEPAWNILLALYQSSFAKRRVTVTDACVLSGAAQTSALRWIDVLESMQLVERHKSELDRRVIFVQLTATAEAKLKVYFSDY